LLAQGCFAGVGPAQGHCSDTLVSGRLLLLLLLLLTQHWLCPTSLHVVYLNLLSIDQASAQWYGRFKLLCLPVACR
jgi:hypothetical protein